MPAGSEGAGRQTDAQLALVTEAVAVHKELRRTIAAATPFWPLGLSGWEDAWVALGLEHVDDLWADLLGALAAAEKGTG